MPTLDLIPGKFYRCIDDGEGQLAIKKGELYFFNRRSDTRSGAGYFRRKDGTTQCYAYARFDGSDPRDTVLESKTFIIGRYYKACLSQSEYNKLQVTTGEYYKVIAIRADLESLTIRDNNGDDARYLSRKFNVKDSLSADSYNERRRSDGIVQSGIKPMVNENFSIKLTSSEVTESYKTPGLFKFNDGRNTFTILAVSYDKENNHLMGFVVDGGSEKRPLKQWSPTWDAKYFSKATGKLELEFT